ncbi:BTAD domain-containing putative transcriptional regulator [Tengunoibacter tsumagoiensis]|uniref:Bacterial transcriptional activator domain-containing protein n=1 Tax=Tengunoibacter tsumagoiensis TaxID=2014871 RepID=A0A402A753_9CHLR|nr:BTAD domain-containing putative transcriptional regulator [Tengunoibacter tsumagoiensis]GCE14964.1 hypothetical protein KTT_48230 [Tengunoibacter tsumagoiensis]
MLTSYTQRKLAPPPLTPKLLHRSSIIQALQNVVPTSSSAQTNYKLILLCAPAGYGKTTLLADFANHLQLQCGWYFLSESDNDIWVFVELFITCIRQCYPQFGPALDSQLEQARFALINDTHYFDHLTALTDAILNAIENDIPNHFLLFLCNYHIVNENEKIRLFMNHLLLNLPKHCTMIIETRAFPALDLTKLVVTGQVFGLGSNSLRFSTEEILALSQLQNSETLAEKELKQLIAPFNGWIAGILLGTRLGNIQFLSSQSFISTWGSPAISMDRQTLFAYLANEVFKQDLEAYAFLKDTSLLQEMTSDICDYLLDSTSSAKMLMYVEQQGLFVVRSEKEGQQFFICHPVLRELFYAELAQQQPDRKKHLHQRAAHFFFAQQNYEEAIHHALGAEDDENAAQIVQIAAQQALAQGYVETVIRWLHMFALPMLERSPVLLLLQAKIYFLNYDYLKARPLLDRACTLLKDKEVEGSTLSTTVLLAEVFIAQSTLLFRDGAYSKAQELCMQAIQLLPENEKDLYAQAYQRMGICSCLQGDYLTGIAQMQQALQLKGSQQVTIQLAHLHSGLANAYTVIGTLALADHHRSRAITLYDKLGDTRGRINNLIWITIAKRNRGDIENAIAMLLDIIASAQKEQFPSGEAYAKLSLSEAYQLQGAFEKALALSEEALILAQQIEDSYLENHLLCSLAMSYSFMGDTHTALLLIERVQIKTTSSSYETFYRELTRGTILLLQQQYEDAHSCFSNLESIVIQHNNRAHSLSAFIRLACCQVALGLYQQAYQTMQTVSKRAQQGDLEHIVKIEVQRFPLVRQALHYEPTTTILAESQLEEGPHIHAPGEVQPTYQQACISVHAPTLQIHTFGEPAVLIDGSPVTHWRMARSQELYFFLLDHDRAISKEHIIATLWPDEDDTIQQTFRSTVYHLRKIIGQECLVYIGNAYQLRLDAVYGNAFWYDVAVFRQYYTQAQQALAEDDDQTAYNYITQMLSCYKGDYLLPFYNNWCHVRRDELRRIYVNARKEIAFITWRDENFDESLHHWQQLLNIDDCSEEAHYGLMRCYQRLGKRELAIRQYQHCTEVLQRELSITPGPTLQKLYRRLIQTEEVY